MPTIARTCAAIEACAAFVKPAGVAFEDWERERTDLLGAYWARLTSDDASVRAAAAAAFVGYELSISKTYVDPAVLEKYMGTPSILIPFAVMEVHYMLHGGWLRRGQLLDGAAEQHET